MISNYNINLHFNQAVAQRTGYAFKIGDKGCKFIIHCEDLDPTGMNPHIIFNHSDGTCVEGIPTTISARDYEYVIQGNEFGVCGKTVVDVKFYDGDPATQRISTASFMIEILPDTITPFDENAGPYADSLERAKEELDEAILDLQGAEHDLDEATSDLADMDALFAQTLQDYIDAFGNTAPINPRSAYDPDTLYKPRDAVYYTSGGKTLTYLNNLECTGVDPTNTSNWQPIIDITGIPAIIDNCTSTSTTDALSANQGRVLADNLVANEESGAKNKLDDDDCFAIDNMDKSGHTFTSNNTDPRSYFDFNIAAYDGATLIQILASEIISSTGRYEYSINIPNNINRISVFHNGSQRNIGVTFYTSVTGTGIISLDVTGVDPTTVGGLSFENIMLRDARVIDPTFAPYAMTNREITERINNDFLIKSFNIPSGSIQSGSYAEVVSAQDIAVAGYELISVCYYALGSYSGTLICQFLIQGNNPRIELFNAGTITSDPEGIIKCTYKKTT